MEKLSYKIYPCRKFTIDNYISLVLLGFYPVQQNLFKQVISFHSLKPFILLSFSTFSPYPTRVSLDNEQYLIHYPSILLRSLSPPLVYPRITS